MEWVNKRIEDAKDSAINAKTFDEKEYQRGKRDAHKEYLSYIERMINMNK